MDKGYKKLYVWQKADEFAYQTYIQTKYFPKEELYGITSQLRRAALSVPTNLAEASGRHGSKAMKYFVNIALGSLSETEYLLEFCFRLQYLREEDYTRLEKLRAETGCMLWGFYRKV